MQATHLCDPYLCVEYQKEDPEYFDGIQNREFWVNLYAESVIYKRKRGVAILRVGNGHGQITASTGQDS
jgi:hypothetical protein